MDDTSIFPYMHAKYTMCFYDFLEKYPDFENALALDTQVHTIIFWNIFNNYWYEYEINGETVTLFKLRLLAKFSTLQSLWIEKINAYETNFNTELLEGIVNKMSETNNDTEITEGASNSDYIDLPNSYTTNEYITNKTNNKSNNTSTNNRNKVIESIGNVNKLTQFKDYMNAMQNIYIDFAKEFKDCFIQLFN